MKTRTDRPVLEPAIVVRAPATPDPVVRRTGSGIRDHVCVAQVVLSGIVLCGLAGLFAGLHFGMLTMWPAAGAVAPGPAGPAVLDPSLW